MPNQNLPVIGICRRCRHPAAGQLVDGDFVCHECNASYGNVPPIFSPVVRYYTFTTSNSTCDEN